MKYWQTLDKQHFGKKSLLPGGRKIYLILLNEA
jgi:hypothetical protein